MIFKWFTIIIIITLKVIIRDVVHIHSIYSNELLGILEHLVMERPNVSNSCTAIVVEDLAAPVTSLVLMPGMITWEFSLKFFAVMNIGKMIFELSRSSLDNSTQTTLKGEQFDGCFHGDEMQLILHQALVHIAVEVAHVPNQLVGGGEGL